MDTKMKFQKSLPPLVEGKIHGYLKLVIDEIIWLKKNFGEIRVFVSWWGETDRAEFRPTDITKDVIKTEQETTEIYAIRTNINLFEEYIKNCEFVELVVVSKETNIIIGTSRIIDLIEIFKNKPYIRYVPIITNNGNKIGEIHVSMKLEYMTKSFNMQLKVHRCEKKQAADNTFSTSYSFKSQDDIKADRCSINKKIKPEESETYKSILKLRRAEFQEPVNKFNNETADKLVAQIIKRAQKLRGALFKETYDKNELIFSDNSINDGIQSHFSAKDETTLHECLLSKDQISSNENKTLCTLRTTSLNPNMMDLSLSSNDIEVSKYDNKGTSNDISSLKMNSLIEDTLLEKKLCINSRDTKLFDLVTYIHINIESFTLSPAGYRRVKSSSLSHNDKIFSSVTYFVQYDMTFEQSKEIEKQCRKENKPVRISSTKQINKVIYFNHSNTYKISKLKPDTELYIKFKIFVRHLNKKSLIELGNATICVNNIIKNENCKVTQHLIIVNKDIKIGELNVIIELGSESSHCERQYIDSIMFAKENIPILDTHQLLNETKSKKSKSITESQSKTNSEVTSISNNVAKYLNIDSDLVTKESISEFTTENIDDKKMDIKSYKNGIQDKVLLHGLIYVIEGQELPELNTYLICRAFWREDKTRSQICNNTENPFYQFCQLVPLIYGNDLLERIKDNYLIIEVYSRNNNIDNLLGLTKLSVHQLYVAYRDPRILPYLMLSKYPVVSVDGWVPIINPVTGQSCGQLHALVALGTAEQITLLKISRNLQTNGIMSCTMHLDKFSDYVKHSQNMQFHNTYELQSNKELISQNNSQIHDTNEVERQLFFPNLRTQECQTDISTVNEFKCNKTLQEKTSNLELFSLHNTVNHLSQVLHVNKINIDQETQTEINVVEEEQMNIEEQICANELNFNNSSNDSDNSSIKHNFYLPTETYRSVGVGAEYNEEIDQQANSGHSNTTFELSPIIHEENELTNSTYKQTMFRVHLEIECALDLPKIEKINETINPSTYVSFQTNKCDHTKYSNSYMITNVFPHSCNPKWNWKCDTELPTELLLHDEKRLILKIWRILDTDISMQINLEKDVVIGFSAIDLSILISGFATVSGWFHIMDFTGKCNGQIKVSVTPLDNLSLFGKPISSLNTIQIPKCSMPWVPVHINETHSCIIQEEEKSVHNENHLSDPITQVGFEDVSMSFLSFSLKQKLTELDEITKRLESRLRDITNTAFEDDLENEFELNNDNANNECKIITPIVSVATIDCNNRICHSTNTKESDNQNISNENSIKNFLSQTYVTYNKALNCEIIKPNSSKTLDFYNKRDLSNNNIEIQQQSDHAIQNIKTLENTFTDYPEQGTKAHISYLLDKLSLQFPAQPYVNKAMPMKENMTNLLTNSPSNSNLQDINKCNQELKMSTLSTPMHDIYVQTIKNSENSAVDYITKTKEIDMYDRNLSNVSQIANEVSTVIREELIAEESSNTSKCDELTTYLVTSNIRHMDINNICNPLLYQHLVPDLHYTHTLPEEETIKQLDNQYSKVFSTSISNRLNKIHSLVETNMSVENTEHFQRMTPSRVSENIDDNIDLTVFHNTNYNDLLTSTESTTTISIENSLVKSIESEVIENGDPTSTETSILVLSRQAPDGGNPIEDNRKSLVKHQEDEILNS